MCAADAFPKPTYRWFHNIGENSLFEYAQKQIQLSEDGSEATLNILANSLTFDQQFTCKVSNALGDTLKVFHILKFAKPEKPSEVSVPKRLESIS